MIKLHNNFPTTFMHDTHKEIQTAKKYIVETAADIWITDVWELCSCTCAVLLAFSPAYFSFCSSLIYNFVHLFRVSFAVKVTYIEGRKDSKPYIFEILETRSWAQYH